MFPCLLQPAQFPRSHRIPVVVSVSLSCRCECTCQCTTLCCRLPLVRRLLFNVALSFCSASTLSRPLPRRTGFARSLSRWPFGLLRSSVVCWDESPPLRQFRKCIRSSFYLCLRSCLDSFACALGEPPSDPPRPSLNCSWPPVAPMLCPPCVSFCFVSFGFSYSRTACIATRRYRSAVSPLALPTRSAINIIRWFVRRLARAVDGGLLRLPPRSLSIHSFTPPALLHLCLVSSSLFLLSL